MSRLTILTLYSLSFVLTPFAVTNHPSSSDVLDSYGIHSLELQPELAAEASLIGKTQGGLNFLKNTMSLANYASNWTSVALGSTAEKFGFDGYRETAYAHYQELHSSHAELAETAKVVISEPGSVLKAAYTGIKETGQGLLRLEPRAVADVEAFKTEVILDFLVEGPAALKNMLSTVAKRTTKQGLKLSDDVFEASLRRLNEALEAAKKAPSLREKYELAREAGFTKHEVRALMDMGIICFSGDTRVHTPLGFIAIADLEEGAEVYSQSPDGSLEAHAIRKTFTTHPDEVFAIRYRDEAGAEHELHGTANHPFYVVEKSEYLAIGDVEPGAHFQTASGESVVYLGMEPIRGQPTTGWTTYNIEVPPNHNYYVQEAQAPANSPAILVHNFGGEKCTPVQGTGIASNKGVSTRPSPRQSELDVNALNPNHRPQVSFRNGQEVPYSSKGSVRPDNYGLGEALEVKNYNLVDPGSRANLYNTLHRQYLQRLSNLPKGKHQRIIIDIRGQAVPESILMRVRRNILTITRCHCSKLIWRVIEVISAELLIGLSRV